MLYAIPSTADVVIDDHDLKRRVSIDTVQYRYTID